MSLIVWLSIPVLLWLLVAVVLVWRGARRGHLKSSLVRFGLLHLLGGGIAALLLIERTPSVVTPLMTTSDKIALRDAMQPNEDASVYQLALDPALLSRGARTAAELVGVEFHSEMWLREEGRAEIDLAVGLPFASYLNAQAEGRVAVSQGSPDIELDSLRIGRIPFPAPLSRSAGWLIAELARRAPITGRAIAATRRAEIRHGRLELDVRRQSNLSGSFLSRFQSNRSAETNRVAWQAVQRWLSESEPGEELFVTTTRDLFRYTRELAPDWPATRQNEAAITAGGFALGHPGLVSLTGLSVDRGPHWNRRAQLVRHARLYDRRDLVQHFWVSAALTQLTTLRISDSVGLAKEEMDSGNGGSGFSFPDLLADRAGIRFAQLATESETSAQAVQRQLAAPWKDEQLVPPITGLPEGLSEAELHRQLGGVTGPGFKALEAEINRRLAAAPLLQSF